MSIKGFGNDCELIVNGEPLSATIDEEIVTVGFVGTIAGASTVTIKAIDPNKKLQQANYFQPFRTKRIRKETKKEKKVRGEENESSSLSPVYAEALLVDEGEKKAGLRFEACAFKKIADEYEMEFEDRDVAILREDKSTAVVSASRDNVTRAQFAEELVKKAAPHIKFHSPNDKEKQPREKAKRKEKSHKQKEEETLKGEVTEQSFAESLLAKLQLPVSKENVRALVGWEKAEGGNWHNDAKYNPLNTTQAAPGAGNTGSQGNIKVYTSWAQGLKATAETLENGDYGGILSALKGGNNANAVAEAIGASKWGTDAASVKQLIEETSVSNVGKGEPINTSEPEEYPEEYKFERKAGEGTWECLQRLAEEVGWRCFMRYGELWFMNDLELADSGTPLRIEENTPGIININWELDKSEKKKPKVTIEARAAEWSVPPGKPVELTEQVGEPVQGLWIVSEVIRKDITDNAVEVILAKPEEPKNEPATKYKTVTAAAVASPAGAVSTTDGTGTGTDAGSRQTHTGGGGLKENSLAELLFNQCTWIANQKYPYVWGGGHRGFYASNEAGNPNPPPPEQAGLDCSGAVSWALHSADMFNQFLGPQGSGEIALQWGEEGEGRYFTVWANTEHVFIQWMNRTAPYRYWSAKCPGTIVGFASTEESTTSFTPKHWPGL